MAKSTTTNRRVNLYINGQEAATNIKEVRAEMQKLINQQARMKIGSDEYIVAMKRIRQLKSILQEHNNQIQAVKKNWLSFENLSNTFNKYFGIITAGVASLTGMVLGFRKISEQVAKMDDIYADVEKTTNLTKKEVKELNEEFKRMDTRTSREQLNKLAADAGKLGITGQENLSGFVDAGNQINVALGEDLGEDAIKNIGKITQVYKTSTQELESLDLKGQMLSVGSAINELGQSSTANEKYLVDFTQRLGGVASQAGISIQNILGYGSALDQSGQKVEMSATALQNFIMKLMSNPAKFARIAGQDIKTFTNLLKTDTNAAIMQVLASLNNKGGFQALIPIFKDMGLDGARAVGVLSSLATNINLVQEAQKIANRGFDEATSVTDEYSKKNTNLQAQLEKARKEFKEQTLVLGEKLNPMLLKSTNGFTYLVKALTKAPQFIEENRTLLTALTGTLMTYIAASAASTIQTSLLSAKTVALSGIKKLYNTITLESIVNKERDRIATQAYVTELEKCITNEQAAAIQKKGLIKNSEEHVTLLEEETQKKLQASAKQINTTSKEIASLERKVASKKKAYISSVNLTTQLRSEYIAEMRTGDATKVAIVQKKLETAINNQNAAQTAYLSSTRDLHTKKIQLETATKNHNTLATRLNTAEDLANASAKRILFSITQKLTLATKALWASMKANPIGWIISLVSMAVTAFSVFKSKTEDVAEANGELATSIKNEGKQINDLISQLTKNNAKESERKKIFEELKRIHPDIVEGINAESIATNKLTKNVQEYNEELVKRIALAAKQDSVNEALEKQRSAGVKMANLEAQARKELLNLQNNLPSLKIETKTGDQSIWDWKEIAESEKQAIITQFSDIFESDSNWFDKILDVQQLFPGSNSRSQKFGSIEFKGVDLSGIKMIFDSMKEIRQESEEAKSAVETAQAEVENFQKTFSKLLGGKPQNSEISQLIDEINLMTDKQRLQELINHENETVQVAAQSRLTILNAEVSSMEDLIQLKEKELEEAEQLPGTTKQEITIRNQKVAAIQKEIQELKNLGLTNKQDQKNTETLEKKKEETEKKLTNAINGIRNELHLDTLDAMEREITEEQLKYAELLALANEFELDAITLKKAISEKIAAIQNKYHQKSLEDMKKAQTTLDDYLMSDSEKKKAAIIKKYANIWEFATKAGKATPELKQKIDTDKNKELDAVDNENKDILGMTPDEWNILEEKINNIINLGGQLSGIWGQFNQIQNNMDKKELQNFEKNTNKKKELLNKQLNSGRLSQEKYNAQVAQLDAGLEKKQTEIARRQAKRDKAQGIFSAIINTSSAIAKALPDIPLSILAGIMGAAQIAVIASTPLPEFAQGGMTDGARVYIAGEKGKEWIAPNNMLNDPITGPIIQQLELVRSGILSPEQLTPVLPDFATMTTIPMYASGGFTGTSQNTTNYYQSTSDDPRILEFVQSMRDEIHFLNEHLSDPRNRQAIISNDILRQNEKEMNLLNDLKHL